MNIFRKIKQTRNFFGPTYQSGLTIIELLVFVGIGSVIIAVLVMMTSRAFDISRQELEQGAITEKARRQIERMSDEIRNAQYVDCNIDGDTADADEHWLIEGDAYSITLYSNVDDDVEAEKVRYFVERDNPPQKKKLKRGVTQRGATLCDFSAAEEVEVVMEGLGNVKGQNNSTPLFHYYLNNKDIAELPVPVTTLKSVLRIRLELEIKEEDSEIDPVQITTDVVPRSVVNPPACIDPGVKVFRYPYTSDTIDFADTAYNECQTYCAPSSECCSWSTSFSWQGNPNWYVWSSCQCEDTYLPPDLTPETVNVGEYTDFAKECMGGSRCSGQIGEPICDGGCLDGPGECVCVCPSGWESTTACSDGIDNDNDGYIDLADPGCSSASDASERGSTQCDDGQDNDNDTRSDYRLWGGDPDCVDPWDEVECGPAEVWGVPQCSDGLDNECSGDGVDYNAGAGDPQCSSDADNNEWSASTQCDDGTDNDGDGYIDWNGGPGGEPADPECYGDPNGDSEFILESSTPPPGPSYACSNDLDDDGDGNIDHDGGPGGEPADPDCIDYFDNSESGGESSTPPEPPSACSNDLDDDGDGNIDWDGGPGGEPADAGCVDSIDNDETDEPSES